MGRRIDERARAAVQSLRKHVDSSRGMNEKCPIHGNEHPAFLCPEWRMSEQGPQCKTCGGVGCPDCQRVGDSLTHKVTPIAQCANPEPHARHLWADEGYQCPGLVGQPVPADTRTMSEIRRQALAYLQEATGKTDIPTDILEREVEVSVRQFTAAGGVVIDDTRAEAQAEEWTKIAPSAKPRDAKILRGASHFWLLQDSTGAIAGLFWNEADIDAVIALTTEVEQLRADLGVEQDRVVRLLSRVFRLQPNRDGEGGETWQQWGTDVDMLRMAAEAKVAELQGSLREVVSSKAVQTAADTLAEAQAGHDDRWQHWRAIPAHDGEDPLEAWQVAKWADGDEERYFGFSDKEEMEMLASYLNSQDGRITALAAEVEQLREEQEELEQELSDAYEEVDEWKSGAALEKIAAWHEEHGRAPWKQLSDAFRLLMESANDRAEAAEAREQALREKAVLADEVAARWDDFSDYPDYRRDWLRRWNALDAEPAQEQDD